VGAILIRGASDIRTEISLSDGSSGGAIPLQEEQVEEVDLVVMVLGDCRIPW